MSIGRGLGVLGVVFWVKKPGKTGQNRAESGKIGQKRAEMIPGIGRHRFRAAAGRYSVLRELGEGEWSASPGVGLTHRDGVYNLAIDLLARN